MFGKTTKFYFNPFMIFVLIGSLFHSNRVKHVSRRKLRIISRIYTPPSLGLPANWSNTQKIAIVAALISTMIGAMVGSSLIVGNVSSTQPIGAYSYMIYQDPSFATNGLYDAKAANGTVMSWSSANQTSVLASVTSDASVGSSIYASAGVFGSKVCHLIVGNGTQSLTAGQVAYQSSQGFYSVASASANSTIGYGYVWLIAINSNANANCLLMNDGVFTLGSWSLTSGLAWVSTTGTVTSTYPSATGNQLVSIGSMLNATTLQVQNPNGNYGEHV